MQLFLIIISSIIAALSIVTFLLYIFAKHVLHDNNRGISITILILLIIQFVLGMVNNLYVTIPKVKSYEIYHVVGPVSIHTVNALFLLIFAIFYAINAFKEKINRCIGILGIVGISIATVAGVRFVNTGGQNDGYSLTMAVGFLVVFLVYTYTTFAPRSASKIRS